MFNNSLKKEALAIHEKTLKKYNETYERMAASAEELYKQRVEAADKIKKIETVVNSIANTPKEYDTKMGKVRQEMETFRKTQEYAQEAYEAAVKAGKNIAGGAAAGLGVAAMAPTALMGIATTFGTAATRYGDCIPLRGRCTKSSSGMVRAYVCGVCGFWRYSGYGGR